MKRTLLLSALFAGAALSAGDLHAQVSTAAGLSLNAHLNGSSLEGEDDEEETGLGLGLALGYGFTENWSVFLNVDGAEVKYDEEDEGNERTLGIVDLGVRYTFGGTDLRLRPYAQAAFSGVAERLTLDDDFEDVHVDITGSGTAFTAGAGLQYFFSPALALDASLQGTWGTFDEFDVDGEGLDEDDIEFVESDFTAVRLQVGVTWHP